MKRLGIYSFYDQDGIVDEYNIYLLSALRTHIDYLLIVVNGELDENGNQKFSTVADDIYIRENTGFDTWGYKTGMEYIGHEEQSKYDEIILFNHTCFGPVYPFEEMFNEMEKRDADFWGITKHYGIPYDPWGKCEYGYIPEHVQSYFTAIRKKMFLSEEFIRYWTKMPLPNGYFEAVSKHEAVFTKKFTEYGFKPDVYIDTSDLKNYDPYALMMYPKELVKNRRCPVFKRKTFFYPYELLMNVSCGQSSCEFYEYLKNETDFNTDLIWDNILRTSNLFDIKLCMHFNYILPEKYLIPPKKDSKPKVALFMHIYYTDMIGYCKNYADNMPDYADVFITTDTSQKKEEIEKAFAGFSKKVTVVQVENSGREISGFLIGLKEYYTKYDYICIVHSKESKHVKPYIIGESFVYQCYENTLASKEFVHNVITTFEDDKHLGLLVPPVPHHGPYYTAVGDEWYGNFETTKNLLKRLNIKVDITKDKPPAAPFGGCFWFRSKALKKLFEAGLTYEDFPEEPANVNDGTIMHAIERIYPYVAQDAKYYTGTVCSEVFAKFEMTNYYKTVRDINNIVFSIYGKGNRSKVLADISSQASIADIFSKRFMGKSRFKALVRAFIGNRAYSKLTKIAIKSKTSKRK